MTMAVRVHKVGGPEALVYEAVEVPAPAALALTLYPVAGSDTVSTRVTPSVPALPSGPKLRGNESGGGSEKGRWARTIYMDAARNNHYFSNFPPFLPTHL